MCYMYFNQMALFSTIFQLISFFHSDLAIYKGSSIGGNFLLQ